MEYYSTRSARSPLPGHQAVIRGLSPDGGLYVPDNLNCSIPWNTLVGKSYQEIAEVVLNAFFPDYGSETIHQCVSAAYDHSFDAEEIVPLKEFRDGSFMELWHGPTSAFKDLALTILPHLLTAAYRMDSRSDTVAILTATSGDTGKAALSGFADVPHTDITVFYPRDGVSAVQKKQMVTSRGENVSVVAVEGNFDDCQRMVKEACSSETVKQACHNVTISSANSINIGRLVPQVVYYFSTYVQLVESGKIQPGDPVTFVVPTGNFGDIFAGWLAKQAGLPVGRLVIASNDNNVLTDFIRTGTYNRERPFHETISPSMDILVSSNLERLLFFASGCDAEKTASLMQQLNSTGHYTADEAMMELIRRDFDAFWCDESMCRKEIHDLFEDESILIDPHTAVALSALHQYRAGGHREYAVVLSTASPYKFAQDVLSAIGGHAEDDPFAAIRSLAAISGMPVPAGLAELESLPERFDTVIPASEGIAWIASKMEGLSHD